MNAAFTIYPVVSGFLLGLSLIVAIGAQNAFILKQGLLREHVFLLCMICALADAVLIIAGVFGLGSLIEQMPLLLPIISALGAIFLFGYGLFAARRAFTPKFLTVDKGKGLGMRAAMATSLAFTFLNPHVYLDTFFLIGGFAAGYDGPRKVAFASGAAIASFVWFFSLGYSARLLIPLFSKPRSWQILDSIIALVMFILAIGLVRRFWETYPILS